MPATWTDPLTGKTFFTGPVDANGIATFLTPKYKIAAACPHIADRAPPAQIAYVPKVRSNFGNDRFGDCVTAEEGFAKSCPIAGVQPEIDIPEATVVAYARSNGELNGADLSNVLDEMASSGFVVGGQKYNDGPKSSVDFSNETVLQSAIAQGPVKIAIAAGALPSGAGSADGWYSTTSRDRRTDHCVALCGYGPAEWLYQQLGQPLPSGLPGSTPGYLLYTWSTIGFVTHDWIMGTTDEAWARNPTTLGVPPLTPPVPPTPPLPPAPPGPTPLPVIQGTLSVAGGQVTLPTNLADGSYVIFPRTVV